MSDIAFWQALDTLVSQSEIIIDRPKGSAHPRYPDFIYPLDYGYLQGTTAADGGGIDVWVGSVPSCEVGAIICIVDLVKRDSEIKILIGCTEEEANVAYWVHNKTEYMKGVLIRKPLENIFDLVPKDKHDISGMATLKVIDIDSVQPILWQLLQCMQDGNWPCAIELLDIMPRFHSILVPHIKEIFNTDDGDWKWFILPLIERFPPETIKLLEADLRRIATQPTMDEVGSEVDEKARKLLEKLGGQYI